MINKNLELLAPVGSFEALKAAVQNGANAVYLGGKDFSARASANNFDRDELIEAVKYCHIRGCRVFVTVNTLIKQTEIEDFIEYIKFLYSISIDALILQDIGMATRIHEILPDFELHASTQMAAHSLNDVKYLESLGFKRVVLARELNVGEIAQICQATDVDIEVFVHGALCVSYSGQCLMSSVMGTRSGNRGRCAQPCRQKYKIYNEIEDTYVDTGGDYLLSPRDLNSIEHIGDVLESGLMSLKIEGRMKRPEYVATVVSSYRDAVLNYLEMQKNRTSSLGRRDININAKSIRKPVSQETIDNLYTIFNRKFTHGYLLGEVGSDIMNKQKPNNRGLYIGKVIGFNSKSKKLKIKLEKELKKGDGLNIGGGQIGRIIRGKTIDTIGHPGQVVEIDYTQNIPKGTEIFKTSDKDLIDRVQKTYSEDRDYVKIPLTAKLYLSLGEYPCLEMSDPDKNHVRVYGESRVEKALKVSIDQEKAYKQLAKLGDTPYCLDKADFEIGQGLSLPISQLNNIRRAAIEELSAMRVKIKERNYLSLGEHKDRLSSHHENKNYVEEINVSCKNIEQLKVLLDLEVDRVYYRDIRTIKEAIKISKEAGKKIYYYMPRIIRTNEKNIYSCLYQLERDYLDQLDGFRLSNYGEIYYIRKNFADKEILVSSWLNIFNERSIHFYRENNMGLMCLSQEMSLNQIRNLATSCHDLEYRVYGYTEMMLSEYCPMGVLTKACKKNKRDAQCSKADYYLESSDNRRYRLSQDENCRTTIYSDQRVSLIQDLDRLEDAGISKFELDFSFEDSLETKKIARAYIDRLKNSKEVDLDIRNYDTGHLYKEID